METDIEKYFNETILAQEGALRDIFVRNTNIEDWEKVYTYLISSDLDILYLKDQKQTVPPNTAREILNNKDVSHTLRVGIENIFFHCYFFGEEEIEFDFDPRDFEAIDQYRITIIFMELLHELTNKIVHLQWEGDTEKNEPLYTVSKF